MYIGYRGSILIRFLQFHGITQSTITFVAMYLGIVIAVTWCFFD